MDDAAAGVQAAAVAAAASIDVAVAAKTVAVVAAGMTQHPVVTPPQPLLLLDSHVVQLLQPAAGAFMWLLLHPSMSAPL